MKLRKNGLRMDPGSQKEIPILVTDDTQMAISVAKALMKSWVDDLDINSLENSLIEEYIDWLNDPQEQ